MGYCPPSRETIDEKLTRDLENTMDMANRNMRIAEWLDGKSEEYRDGFRGAPGSPYISLGGALRGIRLRELDLPFLGTCSGFQHAVLGMTHPVFA